MPRTGHFVLHSNVLPRLTAGRYELVAEHSGLPFDVAASETHVTVAAPRFTMPIDQILSTFPPANGVGAFGDRLPQIVLKRRTLPWERNPAMTGVPDDDPSDDSEPSTTPWLALVVVAEGEAQLSTSAPVAQCVTAGTKLFDPADKDVEQGVYLAVTETVLRKIFPTEEDLSLLTHVREVDVSDTELANGDDDGWLAVVLANRLPVVDLAGKPVRYMACLVNVEAQLAALPKPIPAVDTFEFRLAQDWRFLATAAGGIPDLDVTGRPGVAEGVVPPGVHLDAGPARATVPGVEASPRGIDGSSAMRTASIAADWSSTTRSVTAAALDPDAAFVVRDRMAQGFRLPIELYAKEKVHRFPVLAQWSFTTDEGATFETLMKGLEVGLVGTLAEAPEDAPPGGRPPPEVVATGHLGLGHRARRGDAGMAWYRGPLVPVATQRTREGEPPLAHSADQLRRVVPDGREDLSLAAAFEIGRLLSLSQLSVVSAFLRFRQEQFGAARVRELLSLLVTFDLPEIRTDLSRFVALQALRDFAVRPEVHFGPRRPLADPGREIRFEGNLDTLVAEGLGIDLDAARKLSRTVGRAAALAHLAVPTGEVENGAVLAGTRAALDAALNRTLAVAAPGLVEPGGFTTPGVVLPRDARPPDALDALIDRIERRVREESR